MKRADFIRSNFVLLSGISMPVFSIKNEDNREDSMKIRILYNNLNGNSNCDTAWGFSALAEHNNKLVLFDSGGEPEILKKNMKVLDVDPADLHFIVLSHEHWDHVNGLKYLAGKVSKNCRLFIPAKADEHIPLTANFADVRKVNEPTEIDNGFWLTGQMEANGGALVEQSLILVHKEKIYIITGCSHPGIESITARAREMFPDKAIGLVTGGFHIRDKSTSEIMQISQKLRELGVEKIAPSHCSGELAMAVFRENWGDDFLELFLGSKFVV